MSHSSEVTGVAAVPFCSKPPGIREFTVRSVIVALLVAAVIGASYPYIVMKMGFGPNISVVSAFFGFMALGLFSKSYNRWENNIVQTAGTSAGQTAFLCVLMAAFDMLRTDPDVMFPFQLTFLQSFLWLTFAGVLGVLLAVPMRRHFIDEEKLTYADGVAAAETLVVLDTKGGEGMATVRSMGVATVLSALVMGIREDARLLAKAWYRLPEILPFGELGAKMNMGISWSLLSIGSGMIVGTRINTSMLIGTIAAWWVIPPMLLERGIISGLVRREVLLWVMWPATAMMVTGGLTMLFLRWQMLLKTISDLSSARVNDSEFPMKWVISGSLVCAVLLVWLQASMLGTAPWMTIVAILLSVVLMLVGLRVYGETNWGPISAMSNMMQGIFGVLAPGHIVANMTSSGVTGSIAAQSEGLMQDYKTGWLIGSTPRLLTYSQLLAVPVGAATVAYMYPLLRDTYGLGGEHGLSSPISQKWAGFAKLLSKGLSALPHGAVEALVVGAVLGVVFTLIGSSKKWGKWVPSPTAVGIGMLIPGSAVVTMFIGGLVGEAWKAMRPKGASLHLIPVASGFIAGEAIIAVLIPILVTLGLIHLQP